MSVLLIINNVNLIDQQANIPTDPYHQVSDGISKFTENCKVGNALCDKLGNFTCEGRYDAETCAYNSKAIMDHNDVGDFGTLLHSINPYESAESRIMFSTWNLDHV